MFNKSTLCDRLREAFGNDTQEVIANKLNFTQSKISKLLSGDQPPTAETLYNIASKYNASVDWLLGLSDRREVPEKTERMMKGYEFTYSMATHGVYQLYNHNIADISDGKGQKVNITINDPLLSFLVRKCVNVCKADHDLLQVWFDTKLSLFDSKPVFYHGPWRTHRLWIETLEAYNEDDWLSSYDLARKAEEEFSKLLDDVDSNNEK